MIRVVAIPADDEWRFTAEGWRWDARHRTGALAATQFGRVRYDQLRALGVGETTIRRWRKDGYLYRELPRVYAVGHPGRSIEADLTAALLYAGPGAMLSHATAIWWLGLLKHPSRRIFVSTPRHISDHGNIAVHGRRQLERVWHNRLPATTPSQAILDYAATGRRDHLRLVLANAEYKDMLDVPELQQMMGQGVAGTVALREALAIHQPALARARSELEILLITLCETQQLPIPQVNVYVGDWLVDALWPDERVIVEVDGWRGHRTPAQHESDHRRELELRAAGYIVLRYTWRLLMTAPDAVAADLRRYLVEL